MADGILGLEGFETDHTATMWEAMVANRINANYARSGGMGLGAVNNLGIEVHQSWLFGPCSHVIIGFAFRWQLHDDLNGILEIRGPGDVIHGGLYINGQQCLEVHWQGGGVAFTNRTLDYDTWYYIELRWKVHNTAGEIEVRVNGDPTPELLVTGVDTASGAAVNWFVNQFHIGSFYGFGRVFHFDDIYVRDNTTALGFLGDVEVIGYGLQDDFLIEWVRNQGAKNYENVDETIPDEDATHVETTTAARDLYVVGDTAYQGEILAVQLVSRARKTTTHLWRYRNTMQVSGVDASGPWRYLAFPNYETFPPDVFGNDPNGNPWQIGTFNAMVVGPETEPMDVVP